jgi:ABC-type branched-subunit amino acid transport system substrate-binding protein
VALTGRYAVQGAQVRAGLELWARHAGVRVEVVDDQSRPQRAARIHEELTAGGCRFVLGPYGSDSTREVAKAGSVVWNHGAASDDVQRLPGVVSVASPASRYLVALGRAVAELRPGASTALITAPGRFARFAREGLEREAVSLGIELVSDPAQTEAVLLCGPLHWECQRLRSLIGSGKLLGGLSPGLAAFPELLGAEPEGLLAPVQWHPSLEPAPELGPASVPLEGYIAAQAYAAALIAHRSLALNGLDPLAAARDLRATTFFGAFELDASGIQVGHRLSVICWRSGRQELLLPDAA